MNDFKKNEKVSGKNTRANCCLKRAMKGRHSKVSAKCGNNAGILEGNKKRFWTEVNSNRRSKKGPFSGKLRGHAKVYSRGRIF